MRHRHHRGLRRPLALRTAAWAVTVACCPQCQVTPGTPCHDSGRPRAAHPRRIQEAKETLA